MEENPIDENPVLSVAETIILSAAASVPGLSTIASAYQDLKNKKQIEWIQDTLSKYANNLKELGEKISPEYLTNDDNIRLFERALMKARIENREEKRGMRSNFLALSATYDLCEDPEKDMILEVIDRLSLFNVEIIQKVMDAILSGNPGGVVIVDRGNQDANTYKTQYISEDEIISMFGKPSEIIEASLQFMKGLGVLETSSDRGYTKVDGQRFTIGYRPSPLGITLLRFLGQEYSYLSRPTD